MSRISSFCLMLCLFTAHEALAGRHQVETQKKAQRKVSQPIVEGEAHPLVRTFSTYEKSIKSSRKDDTKKVNQWIDQWEKDDPSHLARLLNQAGKKSGNTLLHRAIARGDFELAERLILKGADPLQVNSHGISPFGLVFSSIEHWETTPIRLMQTLLQAISERPLISDRPFPLSVLDPMEADSLPQARAKYPEQDMESLLERYASRETLLKLLERNILSPGYEEVPQQILLTGTLDKSFRSDLDAAIHWRISSIQELQLSHSVKEIIPFVRTTRDAKLLLKFVKTSPFFSTEEVAVLKNKLQVIIELHALPVILRGFADQHPKDRKLAETSTFLTDFTQHFIRMRLTQTSPTAASPEEKSPEKDCDICFCELEGKEIDLECGHSYHRKCIDPGIQTYLADENVKLLRSCAHKGCEHATSPAELAAMISDPKQAIRIQKLFVRTIPDLKLCPSCGEGIARENSQLGYGYQCQQCEKELCFACGKPPHYDMTCKELNTDDGVKKQFMKQLVANGAADTYGLCPHCNAIIERKDGCDDMTCGNNASDKGFLPRDKAGSNEGRGCGSKFHWERRIRIESALDTEKTIRLTSPSESEEQHSSF